MKDIHVIHSPGSLHLPQDPPTQITESEMLSLDPAEPPKAPGPQRSLDTHKRFLRGRHTYKNEVEVVRVTEHKVFFEITDKRTFS